VDDIAEAAGVAKGSVYYNFGSKTDLFSAVITEGVTGLTDGLRRSAEGLTGKEALAALVAELLTQVHDNPAFAKVIAAEVFRTGRDWQASISLVRQDSMRLFTDAVSSGGRAADADLVGSAIFGATLVAGLEWLAFQPERTFDEVRDAVLRTVSGALG
jgi:AcrR family transcriptional regulator